MQHTFSRRRLLAGATALSLGAGIASSVHRPRSVTAGSGLNVIATTGQVADAVRGIAGDLVSVAAIMGPGVDPHTYTPSQGDIERLSNADAILYSGLELEGRFDEVFESLESEKTIVAVAESIPPEQLVASPQYPDQFDPHVWFDPAIWDFAIAAAAAALVEADPDNAATYEANATVYRDQVRAFDAYATQVLGTVAPERRVLVTAHDAFNYFGRRYGFEVVGIQGISTETEAGVNDLQMVAQLIADRQIPAIFVESSVSGSTIEAVQAAVRDRGFEVVIGGQLYSDAMGDEGTPEGTYVGMFTANVNTIATSLGGSLTPATPLPATPAVATPLS